MKFSSINNNIAKQIVYKGVLNCGIISIPITANPALPVTTQGWNFVGNPYPSAIDWETFTLSGINPTIYEWSPELENYQIYQQGGISLNGGKSIILPAEGFFVKALKDQNANLSFSNSNRVHSTFITSKQKAVVGNSLVLKVSNVGGFNDEMMVRFDAGATMEYEDNLDAVKKISNSTKVPQMYSITPVGSQLAINAIPDPGAAQKSIKIGFESQTNGNYTINVVQNSMPIGTTINLKDKVTGLVYDLSTPSPILFTHNTANLSDRFVLYFNGVTKVNNIDESKLLIYVNNGMLNVDNVDQNTEISIFDVTGKLLINKQINSNSSFELPHTQGIYLVKLQQGANSITKKVFNNNN